MTNNNESLLAVAEATANLVQRSAERELENLNSIISLNDKIFKRIEFAEQFAERGLSIAENIQGKIKDVEFEILTKFISQIIESERLLIEIYKESKNLEKHNQQMTQNTINELEYSVANFKKMKNP